MVKRPIWRLFRLHRFATHNGGAAAVEFAMVALPFFALVFAILETAFVFYAGQALQTAATYAGRLVMTGQAQSASYTASTFKTAVCALSSMVMFDCSKVYVSVQTYASFSAANTTAPTTNGQLNTANLPYAPGGPGDIVVAQLYYQWPIYVSLLNAGLANQSGSTRLLVATAVIQNEPY